MDKFDKVFEEFKVHANEAGAKIQELIHEGNVRRIIVRDEHGHTFVEIPVTVGVAGVILAPVLAAVAAMAALIANFTLVVERAKPPAPAPTPGAQTAATDPSVGATENETDMAGTVPQRVDSHGSKVEDIAGTGEHDSQGG